MIRVGLAGYGLAGSVFHAPLIAATPGMRLTLVATSNAERAAAARREHHGVEIVADADALIARAPELDLLVVATPNATHYRVASAALAAASPSSSTSRSRRPPPKAGPSSSRRARHSACSASSRTGGGTATSSPCAS
jgi:hypothetical protein